MAASISADAFSEQRRRYQLRTLNRYATLLATSSEKWFDFVVLTASDAPQQQFYEHTLQYLAASHRIPTLGGTQYIVIPDPPGVKVGCGGSTIVVLQDLIGRYGKKKILESKILLIHAGGYSKRLPNHSATGKIFSLLPLQLPNQPAASSAVTMLELKCALFADVPAKMGSNGGVFLTCSDDIVFVDSDACDFSRKGFTALGHPSSLEIGTGHGVFVFDQQKENASPGNSNLIACRRFIHKPTFDFMRSSGAVLTDNNNKEYVYSDSSFYWDSSITEHLLEFAGRFGPIQCEIDAYSDFLKPCGTSANPDDFQCSGRGVDPDLSRARCLLRDLLRSVPLYVIPLDDSQFYHIGTMKECIYHMTQDPLFRHELPVTPMYADRFPSACVMAAVVSSDSHVSEGSVVEYSVVSSNSRVGRHCILAGVTLHQDVIPDRTFLQTVPVDLLVLLGSAKTTHSIGELPTIGYVTQVFSTDDDVKKAAKPNPDSSGQEWVLPWAGLPNLAAITPRQIGDANKGGFWGHLQPTTERSLWNARMFAITRTARDSLKFALAMLRLRDELLSERQNPNAQSNFEAEMQSFDMLGFASLADCVVSKHLDCFAQFRTEILTQLKAS